MARWDPWRGCKRYSAGCRYCYIHRGDAKRKVDTADIVKTDQFDKPTRKKKDGSYAMAPGVVHLCFSSDFLLPEADRWREACWKMIKERSDCTFLFLTKRIERFPECLPDDWHDGYDNVVVCCTVEDQESADHRLAIFSELPIKHKQITAQPLLESIDIKRHLDGIECVLVGGESGRQARLLDYAWVLGIRDQCVRKNVSFIFRQCGTHFAKDGKQYKLRVKDLVRQAKLAGIDHVCD